MSGAGQDWRERIAQALQTVQQARRDQPGQGKKTFRGALLLVVGVRNERMRGRPAADAASLEQLNALLSVMSSVEFPLGGYHSERMDLVERQLKQIGAGVAQGAPTHETQS
jgi:hypothetical protein